jgi:hypothetical protein
MSELTWHRVAGAEELPEGRVGTVVVEVICDPELV